MINDNPTPSTGNASTHAVQTLSANPRMSVGSDTIAVNAAANRP